MPCTYTWVVSFDVISAKKRKGGTYDVDENVQRSLPFLDKLRSVVFFPFLLVVFAKVSIECLLSPRTVAWVRDRSKRADRLVFAGVSEELGQNIIFHIFVENKFVCNKETYKSKSTMPTHTMPSNTNARGVDFLECFKDSLREFLCDVAVHVVALVVRRLCGVNVETSAGPKIVRVVFSLDF